MAAPTLHNNSRNAASAHGAPGRRLYVRTRYRAAERPPSDTLPGYVIHEHSRAADAEASFAIQIKDASGWSDLVSGDYHHAARDWRAWAGRPWKVRFVARHPACARPLVLGRN